MGNCYIVPSPSCIFPILTRSRFSYSHIRLPLLALLFPLVKAGACLADCTTATTTALSHSRQATPQSNPSAAVSCIAHGFKLDTTTLDHTRIINPSGPCTHHSLVHRLRCWVATREIERPCRPATLPPSLSQARLTAMYPLPLPRLACLCWRQQHQGWTVSR